jgi:hypothetical protein
VTKAAADNDYGLVLRIVEPHLKNPEAEPADVLTAARRIEKIAQTRYQNRLSRIDVRRLGGDKQPAYQALQRMLEDFRGTQYEAVLVATAARWRSELGGAGGVAAR